MTNQTKPLTEGASIDKALDWLDEMQGHPPAAVGQRAPYADLPTWLREDMGFLTPPPGLGAASQAVDNLSWLDGIASGRSAPPEESPTMSWDDTGNYAAPTAPHAESRRAVAPADPLDVALPAIDWPRPDLGAWPEAPTADPLWDPSAPLAPFDDLPDERAAPTRVPGQGDSATAEAAWPDDDAVTIETPADAVDAIVSADAPPVAPPPVAAPDDEVSAPSAAPDEPALHKVSPSEVSPSEVSPSEVSPSEIAPSEIAPGEALPDAIGAPEVSVDVTAPNEAISDQALHTEIPPAASDLLEAPADMAPDASGTDADVEVVSALIVVHPTVPESAEPEPTPRAAEDAMPVDLASEIPEDPDDAIAWLEALAKRQSDALRERGPAPAPVRHGLDAARIDAMLAAAEPDDWETPVDGRPASAELSVAAAAAAAVAALTDDPEASIPTVVAPAAEPAPMPDEPSPPPPAPTAEDADHPTISTIAPPADLGNEDDLRPTITVIDPDLVESALGAEPDVQILDPFPPVADTADAERAELPLDLAELPPDYVREEPTRPSSSVTADDRLDLTPPPAPQEINDALAWLEELVGRLDGAPIDETTVELENMDVSALLGAAPLAPEPPATSTTARDEGSTIVGADAPPLLEVDGAEETTQPIPPLTELPSTPPLPAEEDDLEAALAWLQSAEDEGSSVIEATEPDTPVAGSRLATTVTELFAAERRRAQAALAAGDYGRFAAEYRTLIDQSPTAAVVAESDLRALSHELPPLPRLTRLVGDACAAQGAFEQAVEHYREALDQSQDDTAAAEVVLPWLDLTEDEATDPAAALGRLREALPVLLQRLDVERIPTVGEAYDPRLHEAVEQEPAGDRPSGLVTAERRAGYRRGSRVVRAAQVVITA